ncbi:hypothetical protein DPEC_G00282270 [Dallia pectoralis]|uniref:Uncharacterized protein n=1 Tax=Dallia pectoralis TaxID=75939 RepID=A0ACC2FN53_DALPE|nr:hypothetical protein DPEC_G00282270 [Dallia pectoralis]
MVDSAALLCPEKKEVFENIPLSRRTVTRRVEDIAENLEIQLQSEVGSYDFFSLALDESCDVRERAQLAGVTTRANMVMSDFKKVEDEMQLVSSPFTCSVDSAPTDVQLELIDLQSDSQLKEHFKSASLLEFYSALKEENFSNIKRHAQKMLVLFGSTYICEQTFSVMKFTKSRYRSSLTDEHLSAVLRI